MKDFWLFEAVANSLCFMGICGYIFCYEYFFKDVFALTIFQLLNVLFHIIINIVCNVHEV